jgi:hypothetical protein
VRRYIGLPHPEVDGAHLLAAEILEQSTSATALERRAWHLVAAQIAPNEALAGTLHIAADNEFAAANYTVAGKLYKRSSELTPAGNTAMWRMLQAAEALRLDGAIDEARTLLRDALGRSSDHNAVPYSLIEEFVAVYRIDPLMPNDCTSGQFGSWPSLRLWVSEALHMRQRLDVYRDGEHCCITWSHERVLRLPPQLAASPQDIVGRTAKPFTSDATDVCYLSASESYPVQ